MYSVQTVVVGDALLVAIGRVPHVEGLGLEAAGVEYDTNQGVKVSVQSCPNSSWCRARSQLTHIAQSTAMTDATVGFVGCDSCAAEKAAMDMHVLHQYIS